MKTITVYNADELKAQFPEAWEKVLEKWRKIMLSDTWTQDEICDSWKAMLKAARLELKDWQIDYGGCSRSWCKIKSGAFGETPDGEDAGENMTGRRAWAWLENNLLAGLRIKWNHPKRWEYRKYGNSYNPGMVEPCPFTGMCYDDDFLDHLRKEIAEGASIRAAFESTAALAGKLCEAESEYHNTEEYILEHLEANEHKFTEDGKEV